MCITSASCHFRRPLLTPITLWISIFIMGIIGSTIGNDDIFMEESQSNQFMNQNSDQTDNNNVKKKEVYKDCGGFLRGSMSGIISTPQFPNLFPYPILCKWVIEAPAGNAIVLYLTQFYLRDGLKVTEYAYYQNKAVYAGKKELGTLSSDDGTTFIASNKPILVLQLEIYDVSNIHLRAMDFFLDVYGFNITYEMVRKDVISAFVPRQDACSVFHCSLTGNCIVSKDFEEYKCQCHPGKCSYPLILLHYVCLPNFRFLRKIMPIWSFM